MNTKSAPVWTRMRREIFASFAILTLCASFAPPAQAERQSAMNLFPHDTLLFVRTADAAEFGERLKDTATGRMMADPQIKPILDRVLGQVSDLYAEQAEGEVGLPWDELMKLPKGELAFGIVARSAAPPAFALLVDQGGEQSVARALLDRVIQEMNNSGAAISKEMIDGVEVTVAGEGRGPFDAVGFFEREGVIVAASDKNLLRHILFHWDGTKPLPAAAAANAAFDDDEFVPGPTLDTNTKFVDIISQCRRPSDPPPNLILYADPIELVRQFGRASPGLQIGLAFLPQLGLDGILGVGGAMTMSTGQFDSLMHVHVLLRNPRAGVLSLLAFEYGDNTPPSWVPYETETYITGRWNFQSFYARLASIVDSFRGEGSFDERVTGRVSQQLGIDVKSQVIENLAGRVTLVAGYEKPVRFQGRQNTLAIEVRNEAAAQQTLQTIVNQFADVFERRQFGRITYYAIKVPGFDEMPAEQRPMNPFVAVFDKHLFIGTSTNLFERIVAAHQGEIERLADSQEYARMTDTLRANTAGVRPAALMMSRPELSWHFWYDLLTLDSTRVTIEEAAADNEVVERFAAILREGGLPPFEVFKPYIGPGGGILYDTNDGFHGVTFSLRGE